MCGMAEFSFQGKEEQTPISATSLKIRKTSCGNGDLLFLRLLAVACVTAAAAGTARGACPFSALTDCSTDEVASLKFIERVDMVDAIRLRGVSH